MAQHSGEMIDQLLAYWGAYSTEVEELNRQSQLEVERLNGLENARVAREIAEYKQRYAQAEASYKEESLAWRELPRDIRSKTRPPWMEHIPIPGRPQTVYAVCSEASLAGFMDWLAKRRVEEQEVEQHKERPGSPSL